MSEARVVHFLRLDYKRNSITLCDRQYMMAEMKGQYAFG